MSPLVWIVSVYYNRSAYVDRSIESLLSQDYDNLRILAVDDGSNDATYRELKKFEARDARFTVVSHPNIGFTRSISSAFAELNGDYFAVHGSGDFSHPNRVAKQVRALQENPQCGFCATANRVLDANTGKAFDGFFGATRFLSARDLASFPPFTHGSVMYSSECYRSSGGYDPSFKFCSDWDLWLRMMSARPALFLGEVLYDQIAHNDGASFNPQKAVEQLKYKQLVLMCNQLGGDVSRDALLQALDWNGLDAALGPKIQSAFRDLFLRHIKLIVMKRYNAASAIREYLKANDCYPPSWIALSALIEMAVKAGIPAHRLLQMLRSVK